MRIRWRGLELPTQVVRDESVSTDTYAKLVMSVSREKCVAPASPPHTVHSLPAGAAGSARSDGAAMAISSPASRAPRFAENGMGLANPYGECHGRGARILIERNGFAGPFPL